MGVLRELKWWGLGESEYVSRCGTFLVQLQDKDWYLFRRISIKYDIGQPKWKWSNSLFHNKKKGVCQDHAETNPEAPPVTEKKTVISHPAIRAQTKGLKREALAGFKHWDDQTNATCWCCGVSFFRTETHRFGDLCGSGCVSILEEILKRE